MLTLNASLVVGLLSHSVSHSIASVANVSDNARVTQLRSGSHSTSKAERKHTNAETAVGRLRSSWAAGFDSQLSHRQQGADHDARETMPLIADGRVLSWSSQSRAEEEEEEEAARSNGESREAASCGRNPERKA